MRWLPIFVCLTIVSPAVVAQEKERKLIDRIFKPDLSLTNAAQNKRFSETNAISANKEFVAKSFYSGAERPVKRFSGLKDFFTGTFGARKFSRAETVPNVNAASARTVFPTRESSLIRNSSEANKSARVRNYADNRPFLGRGTRQEILSQQNHPLTIDEVRELLNKNE